MPGFPEYKAHIAILVTNLVEEGDLYLADVGLSAPIFQAICLDFEEESPEFHNSYNTAKIVKDASGQFLRLHKTTRKENSADDMFPVGVDGWRNIYYFQNRPLPLSAIGDSINRQVYVNPESFFYQDLFLAAFHDDLALYLKNNVWLKESEDKRGKLEPSDVKSDQETVEEIMKYVPNLPRDVIVKAVLNGRAK